MLEALESYDWAEAFGYAGEADTCATSCQGHVPNPNRILTSPNVSKKPFTREDVREIFWSIEGEHDEREWEMFGQLNDGRLFYLAAGCDYTGWD